MQKRKTRKFASPVRNVLKKKSLAQAIFQAKAFHEQYPTLSSAATLHTHPSIQMEQTHRSETLTLWGRATHIWVVPHS
jgi:hypothetical protein